MRMTAAMSSWTWLVGHLKEHGLSLAGISCAMARIALEQCVSRTAGQFGHELAPLVAHTPAERLELVVYVLGSPVWAGLIPTSAMYQGLRWLVDRSLPPGTANPVPMHVCSAWRSALVVRIPATCNAGRSSIRDAGRVTLSVLIVDDSQAFREVARRLLERQGLQVVGTATTSPEAVAQVAALHPRVALVDINLAHESGFDVARRIARSDPDRGTTVILTSTHSESEYLELIAASPAAGFIPKERLSAEAIHAVLARGNG